MLEDFGAENLPSVRALDPLLVSDLTTWNDIYGAATKLVSECTTRLGAVGWTAVGKMEALHLTTWSDTQATKLLTLCCTH